MPSAPLPICEAYFEAAGQLGIPRNHDLTGASQDGVGYYQLTQRNARRSSTSAAFLKPALNRPNLTVRTGAQVLRILVENGAATGVALAGGDPLDQVVERLVDIGYLDDRAFARAWVESRDRSRPRGANALRIEPCMLSGNRSRIRPIVLGAVEAWIVPKTRCPVSAAWIAVSNDSRSRISPTRMISGSSRTACFMPISKSFTSSPISR